MGPSRYSDGGSRFPIRRGPMGYGIGLLRVVEHDGNGVLCFDQRPFVEMHDGAFVDLAGKTE